MLEEILERYPDIIFQRATGLDDAIIGVDERTFRLIYSVTKCIEILSKDSNEDDAREFFDYNTRDAYVGNFTPIWCDDDF